MISDLFLAEDLIDAVVNPYRTMEEHEMAAARLGALAAHGTRIDVASLSGAAIADIELVPGHVWRWAINEAKQVSIGDSRPRLPKQELIDGLFDAETDRMSRLLLIDAVLTHPEVEERFSEFDEHGEAVPLNRLPNIWPRDRLARLCRASERDTEDGQADGNLTELGMLLLQVATPSALALLGGAITTLRQMDRASHSLLEVVEGFVPPEDDDLALRLGIRRPDDDFR